MNKTSRKEQAALAKSMKSVVQALKTIAKFYKKSGFKESSSDELFAKTFYAGFIKCFEVMERNLTSDFVFDKLSISLEIGNYQNKLLLSDIIFAPVINKEGFIGHTNCKFINDIIDKSKGKAPVPKDYQEDGIIHYIMLPNESLEDIDDYPTKIIAPQHITELSGNDEHWSFMAASIEMLKKITTASNTDRSFAEYFNNKEMITFAFVPWLDKTISEIDTVELANTIRQIIGRLYLLNISSRKGIHINLFIHSDNPCVDTFEHVQKAIEFTLNIKNEGVNRYISNVLTNLTDAAIPLSQKMIDTYERAAKWAKTDYNILIEGETGTGKEILANFIHDISNRPDKPFIAINCGSLPTNELFESEMFGHLEGSSTGAKTQPGKVKLADGGTLFLDEIGEVPIKSQAKLLRFIQSKEYWVRGDKTPKIFKGQIVSATNVDLNHAVQSGTFRPDLYQRLKELPIKIPTLTQKKKEIPFFVEYFTERYCEANGKAPLKWNEEVIRKLQDYTWPGNVRELENLVKLIVVEVEEESVSLDNIVRVADDSLKGFILGHRDNDRHVRLRDLTKREFIDQLRNVFHGNGSAMGRAYDESPQAFHKYKKKYGLVKKRKRKV